MAKLNRTCGMCKKKYSYCPSCGVDANKPTWMAIFCGDNCKDLYDVINDYRYGSLEKKDALNKLNTLDFSFVDMLPKNFQEILNEILVEEINEKEIIEEKIVGVLIAEEPVVKLKSENELSKEETFEQKEIIEEKAVEENEVIRKPKVRKRAKNVE